MPESTAPRRLRSCPCDQRAVTILQSHPPSHAAGARQWLASIGRVGRIRIAVLILFVVYMAIGLLGWDLTVTADGTEYLRFAQNILNKGAFTFDGVNPVVGKPPGFSFLIAIYLWLAGSLSGFHWLQLIFMFTAFVFVSATMAEWKGWTWGLILLMVLVLALPLHELTRTLYAEASFMALTSAGLYLVVRHAQSRRLWGNILAGVVFGISTYFRPINLFWPLAIVAFSLIWNRRYLKTAAVICVMHALVVTPWIVRNWYQFGRPVPMVTNWGPLYCVADGDLWKKHFFEGYAARRADENFNRLLGGEFQFNWGPSERFRDAALAKIRTHPMDYVERCLWQSAFAWTFVPGTKEAYINAPTWFAIGRAAMIGFYLLTLLGAINLMRARQQMAALPAVYAVYTALILFPVATESRYLIPPYVWMLPYTLTGTGVAWRYIRNRRRRQADQA